MARRRGWTIFWLLLAGVLGAGIFWLYSPYFRGQVGRQVTEALKRQPLGLEVGKGGPADLKGVPFQALGLRFQLVADGKQLFLADLKEGRVWRYFQHAREGTLGREDEGFLPLALYYGGKKYYSAMEVEPLLTRPQDQPPGKPPEKNP
jgi:hypothetical protein